MDQLNETHYFSTPIYMVKKMEFLETVRKVSNRYIAASQKRKKGKKYVVLMTASYMAEPEVAEFAQYISQTAWNILASQGANMDNLVTYFTEMWTQEHNHLSSMETHFHGRGAQISAFYFLDAPKNGCKFVIHDPRHGKVITNLPPKNSKDITQNSHQIVFTPEAGTLILTNAWVPHSFTKNFSRETVRFVHMNLSVAVNENAVKEEKSVEVI